ncbi:FAD-dependent oxidoreductase [Patescibacteria group bacterium]|nr:FAD-dependent oxidoreductase [Patescibacteria group bacterium]
MDDLIIVGGGPAGLTAALYASRRAIKTLVLAKNYGGQAALNSNIENYPGVESISGIELMLTARNQAEKFGAKIADADIESIIKTESRFTIKSTRGKEYSAKSILLALGRVSRKLGIPNEAEFLGKGVAYCATCDAPLFFGKNVVVVGGNNSAVDAALLLSKIAKQVYLVARRDTLTAEAVLINSLRLASNVKIIYSTVVESIHGHDFVENITVKHLDTETTEEIITDGLFIEIGYEVKADFLGDLVERNEKGEIIIDDYNHTSLPGVFAAGDVTTIPFKQAIISAGEGAKSALAIYDYLVGVKHN